VAALMQSVASRLKRRKSLRRGGADADAFIVEDSGYVLLLHYASRVGCRRGDFVVVDK
jgi:hypothetical protein